MAKKYLVLIRAGKLWFAIDLSNEIFTCIFHKLFTLSSNPISDGSTDE